MWNVLGKFREKCDFHLGTCKFYIYSWNFPTAYYNEDNGCQQAVAKPYLFLVDFNEALWTLRRAYCVGDTAIVLDQVYAAVTQGYSGVGHSPSFLLYTLDYTNRL